MDFCPKGSSKGDLFLMWIRRFEFDSVFYCKAMPADVRRTFANENKLAMAMYVGKIGHANAISITKKQIC